MNPINIAGIQRHTLFSPNHVGNDAAIFTLTATCLQALGYTVHTYTEQEFLTNGLQGEPVVFTMMRGKAAVNRLKQLEQQGVKAVNSAFGIEGCTREQMTSLLMANHIPHPDSVICTTDRPDAVADAVPFEVCWVKRADFHAIHREDVTYVRSRHELTEIIAEYALRGIERVVINEHLVGDLVKFYGVAGTDFFYYFYPQEVHHSKFGLEAVNGIPVGIPFEPVQLHKLCTDAAQVLQVEVYGGDCIVSPDGNIRIIDFNDWPSFAPCRREAAQAIAEVVIRKMKN
ncbi:MAG: hypothetical protein LBN06_09480 [Prevotellaceae bacterium]|jgi:hypothetical protein|nr:hypothetical protein [Prevotellaceae bacterium]